MMEEVKQLPVIQELIDLPPPMVPVIKLVPKPSPQALPDGEASDGYLLGDYKKQSPRFYYFPKDQSGGVVYILVERSSVDSLTRIKDGE